MEASTLNFNARKSWLSLEHGFRQISGPVLILMAVAGGLVIAWLVVLPEFRRSYETLEKLVAEEAAESSRAILPEHASQISNPLTGFESALGPSDTLENTVKRLLADAQASSVSLSQVAYARISKGDSLFSTVQISLSAKGTYPQIRDFCLTMLGGVHFLSLDDISLRRENIGTDQVDANLRFSLFLRAPAPSELKR